MTSNPLSSAEQGKLIVFIILFLPSVILGFGVLPLIFIVLGIFAMKKNKDFAYIETANKSFRNYMNISLFIIFVGATIFLFLDYSSSKIDFNYHKSSIPILNSDLSQRISELQEQKEKDRKYNELISMGTTGHDTSPYNLSEKVIRMTRANLAYSQSYIKNSVWVHTYERYVKKAPLILGIFLVPFIYVFVFNQFFYKPLKSHQKWVESNGVFSTNGSLNIEPKIDPSNKVNIIQTDKSKSYSVADELLKWTKLKDEGHISEEEFRNARERILNNN